MAGFTEKVIVQRIAPFVWLIRQLDSAALKASQGTTHIEYPYFTVRFYQLFQFYSTTMALEIEVTVGYPTITRIC